MPSATVPARAGLAGNPSDAYGGAAVAVPIASLSATVQVVDADALRVVGPDTESEWGDVQGLMRHVARYGHQGEQRLVTASIARLAGHAGVSDDAFEVRWATTIPRSVGLAGSSALVVATLQAVAARWELTIPPLELAHVALAVEVEDLGIAAGLVDRAAQAFAAPVLVDGDGARPLATEALPRLVVGWSTGAAAPSHRVHGPLRARFAAGEPAVLQAMSRLAGHGRAGARALEAGDGDSLARSVRSTFAERRSLGIVAPEVAVMVDALEAVGAAATSAGSGGSVVGILPAGAEGAQVEGALAACCDGVVIV